MYDLVSLLLILVQAALLSILALIQVPLWRSGWSRKQSYLIFVFWDMWLLVLLSRLFDLVGWPFAWELGVGGVLLALLVAALVLLYRHRHDPNPVGPGPPWLPQKRRGTRSRG